MRATLLRTTRSKGCETAPATAMMRDDEHVESGQMIALENVGLGVSGEQHLCIPHRQQRHERASVELITARWIASFAPRITSPHKHQGQGGCEELDSDSVQSQR